MSSPFFLPAAILAAVAVFYLIRLDVFRRRRNRLVAIYRMEAKLRRVLGLPCE